MSIRIVVADDHHIFLDGLKGLIEKEDDFELVGEAHDGQELLNLLENQEADMVITDLAMPNMDGMEAIRKIRERYDEIKILVLTMQKDHEHFKHAMSNGASGYVLKDDAYDQLFKAIRALSQGKPFVSPSVATLLTDFYIRSNDDEQWPSLDILTNREQEVLRFVARGQANKNIAHELCISVRTVEAHRNNLTNKLGIKNTAGLVKYALAKGLA